MGDLYSRGHSRYNSRDISVRVLQETQPSRHELNLHDDLLFDSISAGIKLNPHTLAYLNHVTSRITAHHIHHRRSTVSMFRV